jgi:hypothetical protein
MMEVAKNKTKLLIVAECVDLEPGATYLFRARGVNVAGKGAKLFLF